MEPSQHGVEKVVRIDLHLSKREGGTKEKFNSINVSIYRVWDVRKEALTHLGHFSGQ